MEIIATRKRTFSILKEYNINHKKRYGQNFIINPKTIDNIIDVSQINKDIAVIEIGTGLGALTQALLSVSKKVVSIEIDNSLVEYINEAFKENVNFKLINSDFLKIDLDLLIKNEFSNHKEVYVISNLPYYITSQIIEKILLTGSDKVKKIVIMVQKEFAQKVIGKDNLLDNYTKAIINLYGEVKTSFHVSKNDFFPRPQVDSMVISITLNGKKENNIASFRLLRDLFSNVRKTIINNIHTKYTKEELKEILQSIGIDETSRVEELNIEQIKKIAEKINY